MPLNPNQRDMLEEIVPISRRLYRAALKLQTDNEISDSLLINLFVDSRALAVFVETLWRQSGEQAREQHRERLVSPTRESPEVVQSSEDDPPAGLE
jgi:hypothetical protein